MSDIPKLASKLPSYDPTPKKMKVYPKTLFLPTPPLRGFNVATHYFALFSIFFIKLSILIFERYFFLGLCQAGYFLFKLLFFLYMVNEHENATA